MCIYAYLSPFGSPGGSYSFALRCSPPVRRFAVPAIATVMSMPGSAGSRSDGRSTRPSLRPADFRRIARPAPASGCGRSGSLPTQSPGPQRNEALRFVQRLWSFGHDRPHRDRRDKEATDTQFHLSCAVSHRNTAQNNGSWPSSGGKRCAGTRRTSGQGRLSMNAHERRWIDVGP